MGLEHWEEAISQFRQVPQGARQGHATNTPGDSSTSARPSATTSWGRIPEGNENLEIAIATRRNSQDPDTGIIAGFPSPGQRPSPRRMNRPLLDFIEKNRGELVIDPYAMQDYSRVFMKLAGDAVGAGMERAAMELYQFVPSTEAAIDDLRVRSVRPWRARVSRTAPTS
jgi:hypothetical protein